MKLLEQKHWKEVFVPECKNGCSYGGHLRMDAWVMKKSWANANAIVYEIKVSRSDFLNDNKYQLYLPYCNEFYFVCPPNLIQANEIPDDCGLMWAASTGTRLYTKKKAKHRDVIIPDDLYRYVLMCRTSICKNFFDGDPSRAKKSDRKFWSDWLSDKKANLDLGHKVGKKLWKLIEAKISAVESANEKLKGRMEKYDDIRSLLKKLDIDPDDLYFGCYSIEKKIKIFQRIISPEIENSIDAIVKDFTRLLNEIEQQKTEDKKMLEAKTNVESKKTTS